MTGSKRVGVLEIVYGAVSGGLVSAFIGLCIANVFLQSDAMSSSQPPLYAAMIGLACALGLMVGGMLLADRFSWLATALLFASGFTALWSVALSFSMEQRWASLLVLGIATALGIALGWWRFGRAKTVAVVDGDPAGAGDE